MREATSGAGEGRSTKGAAGLPMGLYRASATATGEPAADARGEGVRAGACHDFVAAHLARVSRTFALAVPTLEPRLRHAVGLAYLLFRVADTLEDAARWDAGARVEALRRFADLVERPDPGDAHRLGAAWSAARPIDHAGYLDLLVDLPRVLAELDRVEAASRDVIAAHVVRTTRGMAAITAGAEGGAIALTNEGELRHYCYVVAGIVGEMLTELFLLDQPCLASAAALLREDAARFGEGLQLVNILKDAQADAREGRTFLPAGLSLDRVRALARDDLLAAARYTRAMEQAGASRGVVTFVAMPIVLARATLAAVEARGPGAKVSRDELFALLAGLERRLDAGACAIAADSTDGTSLRTDAPAIP
jgi:farnesyl-diphosphate farnesyltransferase